MKAYVTAIIRGTPNSIKVWQGEVECVPRSGDTIEFDTEIDCATVHSVHFNLIEKCVSIRVLMSDLENAKEIAARNGIDANNEFINTPWNL